MAPDDPRAAPSAADATGPALELQAIRKSYREGERTHVVLDGVTARLAQGERVAVLGPSGSGKSTLLNLVSGIDLPDEGRVRIGGTDLTALSETERTRFRRHHIGFVFQFFNLLPTLSVMENLLLPLELAGAVGPEERERARGLLARVELEHRADAFPDRLSGGEQQRVALARALAHDPALLLADEPTGNLDEEMAARVGDLLAEMASDRKRTLVLVTHSRALAARMDRVLHLHHGRLVEGGAEGGGIRAGGVGGSASGARGPGETGDGEARRGEAGRSETGDEATGPGESGDDEARREEAGRREAGRRETGHGKSGGGTSGADGGARDARPREPRA